MSICSNVSQKDLENLHKLANQQKNEQTEKIKNRILKQTHDIKLAESLSPITKKLDEVSKSAQESLAPIIEKLDTINDSTIKVSDIIKQTNSSALLKDTFKSLSNDESNALKLVRDEDDNLTIRGISIKSLGDDKILINNNKIYNLSTEMHKALSNSTYTGKSMKNKQDQIKLYNFLTDIGYTKIHGKQTSQMKFFTKIINQFRKIKKEGSMDLKGIGIHKIIIPSNVIDIYSRLEVLLGLKLSGHSDILTEASNLLDELYKRGEIETKQQYQNALNKFLKY